MSMVSCTWSWPHLPTPPKYSPPPSTVLALQCPSSPETWGQGPRLSQGTTAQDGDTWELGPHSW